MISTIITAISLLVIPTLSLSWHEFTTYEQAQAMYFPRGGEEEATVTVKIDNFDADLIFTLEEMSSTSAQLNFANEFYELHLKKTKLVDNLNKDQEIACDRNCTTQRIAAMIRNEVEKRTNTFGLGTLSIKQRWAHGKNLLYHRGAITIAPAIEKFGEWEEESIIIIASIIQSMLDKKKEKTSKSAGSRSSERMTIFDVGANMGLFTLALHHTFPDLEFHTFEPQRTLHNIICANIALLGAELAILPHNIAVSNQQEILQVPIITTSGNQEKDGTRARFAQISMEADYHKNDGIFNTYSVQGLTMSSLVFPKNPMTNLALPCPSMVKIDVEGYERNVLDGMHDMFGQLCRPPVLYFEHHGGWKKARGVVEMLMDIGGYEHCYHHIFDYIRSKNNWMGNEKQGKLWSGKALSSNMLCVQNGVTSDLLKDSLEEGRLVRVDEETMSGRKKICSMDKKQCRRSGEDVNF